MKRYFSIFALLIAVVALALLSPERNVSAASIVAEPVATGLAIPAGFTLAPDGRIFYGERYSGEIRIIDPNAHTDTLFFTITNVTTTREQGLLGLALHPDYPSTPWVYAYVTRIVAGEDRNQIMLIRDNGGSGSLIKIVFDDRGYTGHLGGRILFGPDKRLYAVVGDKGYKANSQNLSNNNGKILRLNPRGGVPNDNPYPGSYVWAYGIRNSFGFAFDPQNGRLWESDNGPECNDELNRIIKGGNYGWGLSATCLTPPAPPQNTNQDGPNPIMPRAWFADPIAPTGIAFCSSCGLGAGTEGRLFVGAWNTGEIRMVTLNSVRRAVASQSVVYTHTSGILSMETRPGESLYFSDTTGIYKLVLQ